MCQGIILLCFFTICVTFGNYSNLKTILNSTAVLRKQVILIQLTCSAKGDFVCATPRFSREQLCGIVAISVKPRP